MPETKLQMQKEQIRYSNFQILYARNFQKMFLLHLNYSEMKNLDAETAQSAPNKASKK